MNTKQLIAVWVGIITFGWTGVFMLGDFSLDSPLATAMAFFIYTLFIIVITGSLLYWIAKDISNERAKKPPRRAIEVKDLFEVSLN